MAGDKPGPDPMLEDETLLRKIKECVFKGMNLKEIAEACEISEATMYTYHSDNSQGIRDKIENWRRDSKLAKADRNIDNILDLPVTEKEFTKVVADMSKFVKETLDKENYSKRSELTGKGGKDINQVLVKFVDGNEDNRNTN